MDTLTPREREMVAVMVGGTTSYRALASVLSISEHTVHTHMRHLLTKTGTQSKTQMVLAAMGRAV